MGIRPALVVSQVSRRLQFRVEPPGYLEAAGAAVVLVTVPLELEHVADVVGARETEAPVDVRRYVVIADLFPKRFGQRSCDLGPRQVLPGDATVRLINSSPALNIP